MELLILSDSHGRAGKIEAALSRQIKRPELLIHLGDGLRDLHTAELGGLPFYAVRGNCDVFVGNLPFSCPDEALVALGGTHLALLTHGAAYGVKGGLGALIASAARQGADLVLYGHTHCPRLDVLKAGSELGGIRLARPMYVFNPGSMGEGRFGTLHLKGETVLFAHGEL